MTRPYQNFRFYGAPDSRMLDFSRSVHGYYVNDLPDFTSFDPDFDSLYGDAFLVAIGNAETYSSDNQLIDVLATATVEVEAKMKDCRDYFQHMKYFIEKAFPGNRTVWNEFGYNDYNRCRKVQVKMIQFMRDLHETATKYATQLATAHFDAPKILQIKTLADALQTANTTQESVRRGRSTGSYERVILLNAVWDICQNIRKAAKVIYANNWGKWQQYLIPWGGEGEVPEEQEEYTGSVAYGQTVNVIIAGLTADSVLTCTNTGEVVLKFCGSEFEGTVCNESGLELNPGDSQAVSLQEISPEGSNPLYLSVSNIIAPPGSPDGEYSIIKVS